MKKRAKRRLDFERALAFKSQNKKIDEKLQDQVNQYEALNETLKLELPKLSALTVSLGKTCLAQLVQIQTEWYDIWQGKVRAVLETSQIPKNVQEIVEMHFREFKYVEARTQELGIISGYFDSLSKTRGSQSTQDDESARPSLSVTNRSRNRGHSVNSDKSPSLPTPDFAKRSSGQFTFSPLVSNSPGLPQFVYQTSFSVHARAGSGSGSPATPDGFGSRQHTNLPRPNTGRSYTSDNGMRPSNDYNTQVRRESGSGSIYNMHHADGPHTGRPYSGVFHSALPDGPEESQRSSRASSRDRNFSGGYNVLYLAASLFEFNISATKSEAGYPYLTYQAGEVSSHPPSPLWPGLIPFQIFDVIGEKGELWLAKNQDDPSDQVGWIWSKHFARLATD
jgi:dynamin-binding protein